MAPGSMLQPPRLLWTAESTAHQRPPSIRCVPALRPGPAPHGASQARRRAPGRARSPAQLPPQDHTPLHLDWTHSVKSEQLPSTFTFRSLQVSPLTERPEDTCGGTLRVPAVLEKPHFRGKGKNHELPPPLPGSTSCGNPVLSPPAVLRARSSPTCAHWPFVCLGKCPSKSSSRFRLDVLVAGPQECLMSQTSPVLGSDIPAGAGRSFLGPAVPLNSPVAFILGSWLGGVSPGTPAQLDSFLVSQLGRSAL